MGISGEYGPSGPSCWTVQGGGDAVYYSGHYDHVFMEHMHEDITFVLVTSGAVAISIDGMERIVTPGRLAIIGPQQVHMARPAAPGGWSMLSAQVSPGLFASEWRDLPPVAGIRKPVYGPDDPVTEWFVEVCRESRRISSEAAHNPREASSHLKLLDSGMQLLHFEPQFQGSDHLIQDVRIALLEQCFDNTSMQELAYRFKISEGSLIKRFRRRFGISPHRWRVQKRANEAARLLRAGHDLADTSALCGFSDQPHMQRTFKRVFGVTPGSFSNAFGA